MELTKTKLKQTECGLIPDGWERIKLDKVIEVHRGGSPRPIQDFITLSHNGVNWIKIGDTSINSKYITGTKEKIIEEGVVNSRKVSVGDFLLSNSMSFGRPYILKIDGCIHDGWLVLQNYQKSFDREFLYYTLMTADVLNQYLTKASGSGVLNLNKELVKTVELNRPVNLKEQRAIAQVLSDTDSLVQTLEQKLAKKRAVKQGAMQQLLTPKGDWEVRKLGEVAYIEMGQSPSSDNYNVNGIGLPLVQGNADINNRRTIVRNYTSQITKRCLKGDIIMSVRAPVGEIATATQNACIGRGVCAIRYSNKYLLHYLIFIEPRWAKLSTGSTFDSVNSDTIKNLEIPFPPKDEQIRIATILSDMDAEIAQLEQKLDKYKLLKQGLMQELLTGRIRLL